MKILCDACTKIADIIIVGDGNIYICKHIAIPNKDKIVMFLVDLLGKGITPIGN